MKWAFVTAALCVVSASLLVSFATSAVASVQEAGGTKGFFPWVLQDRFQDMNGNGRWNDAEPFDDTNGNGEWDPGEPFDDDDKDGMYDPADFYDPVLTGYQTPADAGLLLEVKQGDPICTFVPGFCLPVRFPPLGYYTGEDPRSGGAIYREWIINKSPYLVSIGDVLRLEFGNMTGPTARGVREIMDACPTSFYDPVDNRVKQHSHPGTVPCPRVGAIAFFDPSNVQEAQDKFVTVVKISHWFVESMGEPHNTVYARLIELVDPNTVPGLPPGSVVPPSGRGPNGITTLEVSPIVITGPGRISYELAAEGPVSLMIYDAAGRLVRTLANGHKAVGRHEVTWDRKTDDGRRVNAGVYFVRFEQRGKAKTEKLLVVK